MTPVAIKGGWGGGGASVCHLSVPAHTDHGVLVKHPQTSHQPVDLEMRPPATEPSDVPAAVRRGGAASPRGEGFNPHPVYSSSSSSSLGSPPPPGEHFGETE